MTSVRINITTSDSEYEVTRECSDIRTMNGREVGGPGVAGLLREATVSVARAADVDPPLWTDSPGSVFICCSNCRKFQKVEGEIHFSLGGVYCPGCI